MVWHDIKPIIMVLDYKLAWHDIKPIIMVLDYKLAWHGMAWHDMT